MSRSILAASLVRPVWESAGVRVEGPDEDAFTLAAAAVEMLGLPPDTHGALERIDLVGEFPPDAEWAMAEALGVDGLDVRRRAAGVPSFLESLATMSMTGRVGAPGLVVAADVSTAPTEPGTPRSSAAATAILIGDGAGASIVGHTSRHHPVERRPDASAWVRAAHKAAPNASAKTVGLLGVIAEAPPPVLLAQWKAAFPAVQPVVRPWELAEWGHLPTCRAAIALHEHLTGASPGTHLFVAAIRRERTDFLALQSEGALRWAGAWTPGGPALTTPHDRPFPAAPDLAGVSEGAYVPRPRYVENLPSRWRFVADRCAKCQRTTFPARGYCRHCGTVEGLTAVELPREGLEVEAVTTIAPGAQPTEFDGQVAATGPYGVVLVRLTEGVRATLQLTDAQPDSVRIGDRVATRLRRLYPMEGAWRYGRKAVPQPAPAGSPEPGREPSGGRGSQGAPAQLS